MAYFVGTLGNLLPLPGGLGGVEGGMIGALAAFGVDFNCGARRARLPRVLFWLPTLPGGVAYLQLRRTVARWRGEQSASTGRAGGGPQALHSAEVNVTSVVHMSGGVAWR